MPSGHEMPEGGAKYAQEKLVAACEKYRNVETITRIIFSNFMFQTCVGRLGKHCNQLKRLSVVSSNHVDDSSLIHLQTSRNLVFLNVDDTNVTPMGYGSITCNLPKLRFITWAKIINDVLLTITKDEIQTVKSLTGIVRNALSVVVKCPFIKHFSLFEAEDNLSTNDAVSAFTLADCDSGIVKLAKVLKALR
jgi:hypothetical protein